MEPVIYLQIMVISPQISNHVRSCSFSDSKTLLVIACSYVSHTPNSFDLELRVAITQQTNQPVQRSILSKKCTLATLGEGYRNLDKTECSVMVKVGPKIKCYLQALRQEMLNHLRSLS